MRCEPCSSGRFLIGMMVVWQNSNRLARPGQTVSIQTLATYGENLYEAIVSIELTLVLLAAPAATAGAICLDKARGTLDHMLATDLSNAEIVLGKIGVRLVPVLGLIACVLPLTALTSLLGGIDPTGPLRLVHDGDRLRRSRLLAGPDPVGLGPKNARSADDHLFDTDSLADQPLLLLFVTDAFGLSVFCQLPRRPSGNGSSARIRTTSPSHPTRILARSD